MRPSRAENVRKRFCHVLTGQEGGQGSLHLTSFKVKGKIPLPVPIDLVHKAGVFSEWGCTCNKEIQDPQLA